MLTYEIGQRAVELLLARLDGQGPDGFQEIVLPVEIIVRQPVGSQVSPLRQSILRLRGGYLPGKNGIFAEKCVLRRYSHCT